MSYHIPYTFEVLQLLLNIHTAMQLILLTMKNLNDSSPAKVPVLEIQQPWVPPIMEGFPIRFVLGWRHLNLRVRTKFQLTTVRHREPTHFYRRWLNIIGNTNNMKIKYQNKHPKIWPLQVLVWENFIYRSLRLTAENFTK